ncbi:MAG TPA: Flp family type IVb pilin [Alphaproteobacteria bacterium]|jgi:pilus assembly protein Flp/PilA
MLRKFAEDRSGATAIEYALLIGLVALASVTAWSGIGEALSNIFQQITSHLV